MSDSSPKLQQLLDLEHLEVNLFRGQSHKTGAPQVFGGQVLGQALVAASRTVENYHVHSLHSYFLRGGDIPSKEAPWKRKCKWLPPNPLKKS